MNKILIIISCSLRHLYFANKLLKFLSNMSIKIIFERNLQKTYPYKRINYSNIYRVLMTNISKQLVIHMDRNSHMMILKKCSRILMSSMLLF